MCFFSQPILAIYALSVLEETQPPPRFVGTQGASTISYIYIYIAKYRKNQLPNRLPQYCQIQKSLPNVGDTYCQIGLTCIWQLDFYLATYLATGKFYIWQIWQQNYPPP